MQGAAILLFGNDVAPQKIAEYEHWHAVHHVPQRLEVEGILGAIRFRSAGNHTPKYLTLYRLASVDVLESAEYRALVERPDAETLAMRPHTLRPQRFVAEVGAVPPIPHGAWMLLERSLSPFVEPASAPLSIEGRLVDQQRNHPIMGDAKLPIGMIRLGFASRDFFKEHLPEGLPGWPEHCFYPLDRFGMDAT
jgi:hypothetical protein